MNRAERSQVINSQHVGQQGKRLRGVAAQVHLVIALGRNTFGRRTLVKFLDADGNLLTWFACGARPPKLGASVVIDGTVKCFKEYQGVKETQLSRVAVRFAEAGAKA